MALIKCVECNKEISDKAETCISCGSPVVAADVKPLVLKGAEKGTIFGTVFGLIIVYLGTYNVALESYGIMIILPIIFFGGLFAMLFTKPKAVLGFWMGFICVFGMFWIGGSVLGIVKPLAY